MFSELVDTCVARSGRVDKKTDIASWANLTVQQMTGKHVFEKNMVEDLLATTADPYTWQRPTRWQRLRTVYYQTMDIWPEFVMPGRAQRDKNYFYYGGSTYYVFKGCLVGQESIKICYYQYPPALKYLDVGKRPAVYHPETDEWEYFDLTGVAGLTAPYNQNFASGDPATELQARELVSNWCLMDYQNLTEEGVLAKIFKGVDDQQRAATHYSFFETNYREVFLQNEIYTALNV